MSRFAQVAVANGPFVLGKREVPRPGSGQVTVRVRACGICHSDNFVKAGAFPGLQLPRVPGHEVAGVISAVGAGVRGWKEGERVGVGWHGGHCFICDSCRAGDFVTCREEKICGISYDGGFAEHLVAPAEALARIPDGADATPRRRRSSAPASRRSTRCATARRGPATSWRCKASAVSGTWPYSSPATWASRRWRWRAAPTSGRWRSSSAPATTSTRAPAAPRRRSPPAAVRRSFSPPLRAPAPSPK